MSKPHERTLLDALLDSWDRNNTILVNLLHAVPEGGLDARATADSPSVVQMFTHIHHVRMVFIAEDAPEFAAAAVPPEWTRETDLDRLAGMLNQSAQSVREAVRGRLQSNRDMDLHYDHPILFLQHMIWHEGYHHGQIKLALKLTGRPIPDKSAGPLTWRVWMNKTAPPR